MGGIEQRPVEISQDAAGPAPHGGGGMPQAPNPGPADSRHSARARTRPGGAAASHTSALREAISTRAPADSKASAQTRPSPAPPPVTSATRPFTEKRSGKENMVILCWGSAIAGAGRWEYGWRFVLVPASEAIRLHRRRG